VQSARRVVEQWGTVISVDVRRSAGDPPFDERAIDACFSWFARVDDLFSTWRPDTEIMRIASGELAVEDACPEVRTVLELCEQMRLESGGAFDISFGARAKVAPRPGLAPLDPSGLVKGWAVARGADLLREAGASNFFVNAGGDVLTRRPSNAADDDGVDGWRLGIQHPWERDRVAAVLMVSDAAIATSGRYERGDHVVDPRSGLPAMGLASVTVVGPDLAIADAYATAAVVLGPGAGMRWLTTRAGYEGMGITDDRVVLLTPGFDRYRVS
jgi:thiamine biosynthesis lipoprotein